jgi:hypothetical protein
MLDTVALCAVSVLVELGIAASWSIRDLLAGCLVSTVGPKKVRMLILSIWISPSLPVPSPARAS